MLTAINILIALLLRPKPQSPKPRTPKPSASKLVQRKDGREEENLEVKQNRELDASMREAGPSKPRPAGWVPATPVVARKGQLRAFKTESSWLMKNYRSSIVRISDLAYTCGGGDDGEGSAVRARVRQVLA
jgi:hypothetical protein